MSRSFKKTPYSGDAKGKDKKRLANDKVKSFFKRNKDIQISHGDYRKIQNPWDICDFYSIETFEEYKKFTLELCDKFNEPYPSEKEMYRDWYKAYKMK